MSSNYTLYSNVSNGPNSMLGDGKNTGEEAESGFNNRALAIVHEPLPFDGVDPRQIRNTRADHSRAAKRLRNANAPVIVKARSLMRTPVSGVRNLISKNDEARLAENNAANPNLVEAALNEIRRMRNTGSTRARQGMSLDFAPENRGKMAVANALDKVNVNRVLPSNALYREGNMYLTGVQDIAEQIRLDDYRNNLRIKPRRARVWRAFDEEEIVDSIQPVTLNDFPNLPIVKGVPVGFNRTQDHRTFRSLNPRRPIYDLGRHNQHATPYDDHVRKLYYADNTAATAVPYFYRFPAMVRQNTPAVQQAVSAGHFYAGPDHPMLSPGLDGRFGEIPAGASIKRVAGGQFPGDFMTCPAIPELQVAAQEVQLWYPNLRTSRGVPGLRMEKQRVHFRVTTPQHRYAGEENPLSTSSDDGPIVPKGCFVRRIIPPLQDEAGRKDAWKNPLFFVKDMFSWPPLQSNKSTGPPHPHALPLWRSRSGHQWYGIYDLPTNGGSRGSINTRPNFANQNKAILDDIKNKLRLTESEYGSLLRTALKRLHSNRSKTANATTRDLSDAYLLQLLRMYKRGLHRA